MEIYVLNTDYASIGMIDEYESVLWQKKYNDVGEAEIYLPASEEMMLLLQKDFYLYRFDDDMFCKIAKTEIKTNAENGDYIISTASDICKLLAGRIILHNFTFSGTVGGFIKKILLENFIDTDVESRKIANLIIDDTSIKDITDKITYTTNSDDALKLIIATCKAYNCGFRITYDIDTQKLIFRLYKGKNKATIQSGEYVEFSPSFANIIASNYKYDATNYKNVAYVSYKNLNGVLFYQMIYIGNTEPIGEDRHEIFVNGANTSRDITFSELQEIFPTVLRNPTSGGTNGYYYITENGAEIEVATFESETVGGGYEEKITVTDYTYRIIIKSLGYNALIENANTQSFSGEVDTINTYIYKRDYDLGDIIKVKNQYGIEADAQITEIMESDDTDNGYAVEPKFEYQS